MTAAQKDRAAGQEFLSLFLKLDDEDRRSTVDWMNILLKNHPQYRASSSVTVREGNVIKVDFRK